MGSEIIKKKIVLLEKKGYGKEWVITNYFEKGLAAEVCCKIFKSEANITFTSRGFKILLNYYKLDDKSKQQKINDRSMQQKIAAYKKFKDDCEDEGFNKEWFIRNYSQYSISEIVEILRKNNIKAYKANVKKLLIEYNIDLRTKTEVAVKGKIKARESNMLKYGVDNVAKSEIVKTKSKITIVKNLLISKGYQSEDLVNLRLEELLELSGGRFFEVNQNRTPPKFTNGKYSKPELEIKNIIESFGFREKIDYLHNNRSILAPFEVDFYIPDLKLGIEINPFWTHCYKGGFKETPKDYHYNKLELAFQNEIDLLQYFPFESLNFKDIFIHKIRGTSNYNDYYKNEHIVDGDFGDYKNLLNNGYKLIKHLYPELINVTRDGEIFNRPNYKTLELYDAGKLIYKK